VNVLLTNDDGVQAPALLHLRDALSPLGRVIIVAPDRDQSATSHALTLQRPFRIQQHEPDVYSVDGTPTDCVITSFYGLLDQPPDLVISGINLGPNMGEDVFYSGTVAAAIEGSLQGTPAIAASFAARSVPDLAEPARFIARLVGRLLERGLPRRHLLNVKLPRGALARDPRGAGHAARKPDLPRHAREEGGPARARLLLDRRGGSGVGAHPGLGLPRRARGWISVTPLRLDFTADASLAELEAWSLVK